MRVAEPWQTGVTIERMARDDEVAGGREDGTSASNEGNRVQRAVTRGHMNRFTSSWVKSQENEIRGNLQ